MGGLVEHFGSPMINEGMQQTISVFNLGGVVQHFSSPTGNPISAFADGGSTDTDNSEQAKDLRDIKSLINEYRNCLMQKAVCCASDRMMQSHVYKQKAMECKLRASKLIDSYHEKYGGMENSPFTMVDMDEMNQYADGGEMVIRYSVYDEEGDLVEMGLSASELIELASTIYYYDAMDADEENISTLDEAMDGFEAMGYSVRESEYGFANGGKVRKQEDAVDIAKEKLNESFALPIEMAVYVPSTKGANEKISNAEFRERIEETEKYLSSQFGGYSKVDIDGGYVSDEKGLIKEDVAKVVAFAQDEDFLTNRLPRLIKRITLWCEDWTQESIGFEIEGDLFYIDKNFEYDKEKFNHGGKTKERVYIDFLNKKKNFQKDRKYFDSYDEARNWAIKTMDKFNPDMIKYEFADGGKFGGGGQFGGVSNIQVLSNSMIKEIRESAKMGYNIVQVGMISPKRKGVVLMNEDYEVRGTYPLEFKEYIEKIVEGKFSKGGVTKNLKRIVRKGTKYGKLAVNKAKPKAKKIIRKAKLGFDALAKKVAQAYEGKKVAPKYQKQYGKTYSKQEAQEVGNKVAAKVKMMKGL